MCYLKCRDGYPVPTWLATCENTLFALLPIRRTVPITITRITANITAYSAMSCPSLLRHKSLAKCDILGSFKLDAGVSLAGTGSERNPMRICGLVSQIWEAVGNIFSTSPETMVSGRYRQSRRAAEKVFPAPQSHRSG